MRLDVVSTCTMLAYLTDDALGARHDDSPLRVGGGHGCHEKPLPPLLLDPLVGKRV